MTAFMLTRRLEAAGATPDMSAADLCTKMIEQFTSMTFDGLTGNGMTWNEQGQVTKSPEGHGHPERRLRRSGLIGKKPDPRNARAMGRRIPLRPIPRGKGAQRKEAAPKPFSDAHFPCPRILVFREKKRKKLTRKGCQP